ncbi:MAG: phytanoyl-CoA dioxygenase [Phycisphaerae bacterium]|nr:MAG: phytanoyl-CoA dioxygenase [Phycisphaerae bacterium]
MSLDDQGFTIIDNVVSTAACDELIEKIDNLGSASAGSRRLLDHVWCRQIGNQIQSTLVDRLVVINQLIPVQCTYFHKTPTSNWLVTWHQDRSIPVAAQLDSPGLTGWSTKEGLIFVHGTDEILSQMIAVRLHLDDSTSTNGPLRVVQGSHRSGTLSENEIEPMRRERGESTCIVPKGGVLAMRPLILHASSKSKSEEPRRVLHFLFGPQRLSHGLSWACIGST